MFVGFCREINVPGKSHLYNLFNILILTGQIMKRFSPLSPLPPGSGKGKKLFPLLMLLALLTTTGLKAQIATYYVFSQQTGTYDSLVSPTVLATATSGSSLDNFVYDIPSGSFPFTFTYNGTGYTGCKVTTNGFISFGTTAPSSGNYTPISSSAGYSGAISAWGADLNAVFQSGGIAGNVSWAIVGTAPNREVVIEWKNFRPAYSSSSSSIYRINFQIRLEETTNRIKVVYGPSGVVTGTPSPSGNVEVGLRGTTNSDYNNRTSSSSWASTTAGTSNSDKVSFSTSNMPASGLTLIWDVPPPCVAPVSQPTALVLTPAATSIAGSFTAASPAVDRYLVVRTTGAAPTNPVNGTTYTTGAGLGGNIVYVGPATSFNNTGLTGNTGYTYYIFGFNSACSGGPLYNTTSPLTLSDTTCVSAPGSLTSTGITTSGATLGWGSVFGGGASPVTYTLEVSANNTFTAPVSGSPFTIAHPAVSQAITGLAHSTTYYYRVKADNGCASAYSSTSSFTTLCGINSTPTAFTEGFGTYLPPCWSEANVLLGTNTTFSNTSSSWTSDDYRNVTNPANQSAKLNIYGTGVKEWLVTPSYDLGTGNNMQMEFDLAMTAYGSTSGSTLGTDDKLAVVISTDNGATWSNANILRLWNNTTPITNAGQHIIINLASYTGVVKFGFYGESTVTNADVDVFVDNFAINIIPACQQPTALAVDSVGAAGARLNWTPGASETLWNIEWGPSGFTQGTGTLISGVNTRPYVLNGLSSTTTYSFYVQADCGGALSAWTGPFSFTTRQTPVTAFPYTFGFETGFTNWETSQNGQVNKWTTGTATSNGGTQGAYISNDNGVTNAYSTGTSAVAHLYRDIQVPAALQAINLSFDWKGDGENDYDYLRVWLVPTTYTPTAGSTISATGTAPAGRVRLGGNLQDITTYQTNNYTIPSAYAGQSFRLVFEWTNDGGSGTQPPAAIDNIVITATSCLPPSNLSADSATAASVKLSWTENGTATAWNIQYGAPGFTLGTGTVINGVTNPYVLNGLTAATTYSYYVQAACGAEQSTWAGPYTFGTSQVPVTSFPYTQDFEAGLDNWQTAQTGQANIWTIGTATSNGGTQGAYISNDNGVTNAYNTGTAAVSFLYRDIHTPAGFPAINLSFDWKNDGENGYDYLRVWLVPTSYTPTPGTQITAAGNGPAGRVQLGGNLQDITAYQTANFVIPPAYSNVPFRLVFEWRNDGGSGAQPPAAIDNIHISVAACLQPSALTADSIAPGAARLRWTENGAASAWNIEYGPAGFTPGTGTLVPVSANPYLLNGLNPETAYSYYVQADCGADSSAWAGPFNFTTLCQPIAFSSTTPGTRCGIGTVTLGATPAGTGDVFWYSAATGGTVLGTGNSFTTPAISATTTYYAETQTIGTPVNVGLPNNTVTLSYYITNDWGITFNANAPCRINSVAVYPGNAGTITIAVQSSMSNPTVFGTVTYTFTSAQVGTKVIIPMNVYIPTAGTGYKMVIQSYSGMSSGLHRESTGITFPYSTPGSPVTLTSSEWGGTTTGTYYFFYDWSVEKTCVSARVPVTATVTTAPAIALSVGTPTICEGTSTTVSASSPNAGYSYVWNPGNLHGASQNVSPASTRYYTVTATDTTGGANAGCSAIDSIQVNVTPLPQTPVVSPAAPSICIGAAPTQMTVTALPPVYSAPSGTGTSLSASTSTGSSLGPNPMQNYYGGTRQQMLFLASELQAMGVPAGPITGLSIDLSQAGTTYALQDLRVKMGHTANTSLSTWVGGLTTVRPAASYTPVVGANGLTFSTPFVWNGTDNVVVEINYSNNNTGSGGTKNRAYYTTTSFQSTIFYRNDNLTGATIDTTSAISYSYSSRNNISFGTQTADMVVWSPATNLYTDAGATTPYVSGANEDSVYFNGTGTQTYTVTRTGNGCTSQPQSVTVTVNPVPVVSAGNDTTICAGSQITLSGSGAASYTWDNSVSNGVAFAPAATTTYTVTGTGAGNCQGTDQVTVTVNPLPVVSAGADTAVCAGTILTLNGSGAGSYSWNNGISDGVAFTAATTTTYTVTGTDANQCSNSDSVLVTVYTLPVVSAGADTAICAGTAITLSGSGAAGYSWNNGVSDGVAFTPAATLTYTVTGTDANQCSNTDSVTVTVNANPVVNLGADITTTNASEVLTAPAGFASYLWNTGELTQTITVSTSGTYSVQVTDANGCAGADTLVFITTFSVENGDGTKGVVNMFPNPTSDVLNVRMEGINAAEVQLEIISVSGAVLAREVVYTHGGAAAHVLNLGAYAEGVYMVRLTAGEHATVHRIVVNK